MGANLTGMAEGGEKEATAQERTKGGASGVQQEAPHAKDQSPAPSDTACPEPQPVSTDKARTRRTKFRSVIGAIEDIQRMPEKAIYEEFNRLLMNSDPQLTPLGDPPCRDVAARLKTCLQRSRERSCNCFKVMEQYQHCVIRATQDHLDDLAYTGPATMVVVTPKAIPPPAYPPATRSRRRWYKFWTWFRS